MNSADSMRPDSEWMIPIEIYNPIARPSHPGGERELTAIRRAPIRPHDGQRGGGLARKGGREGNMRAYPEC